MAQNEWKTLEFKLKLVTCIKWASSSEMVSLALRGRERLEVMQDRRLSQS